jgi:hypothetical protein
MKFMRLHVLLAAVVAAAAVRIPHPGVGLGGHNVGIKGAGIGAGAGMGAGAGAVPPRAMSPSVVEPTGAASDPTALRGGTYDAVETYRWVYLAGAAYCEKDLVVGPRRCCLPRHRMPFGSS